jgi:chemotaxis protein methyltransferase CheR
MNKTNSNQINSLLNSYSEFFRNSLTFSVLERIVLPDIIFNENIEKRKTIRIWSAACASGQEAYSLAILLEGFNNGAKKVAYRIFGTDIDNEQVRIAQQGHYSADQIGNVTHKQLKKWFAREGDQYKVMPELKSNIEFSVFDLLSSQYSSPPESIFGGFDIVMCANLLFYYQADSQKTIIEKIKGAMAENGYLITGETERDILLKHGFKEVFPQSAIYKIV